MRSFSLLVAIPGIRQLLRRAFASTRPGLEREAFGCAFRNPVGLAAGFDKDAQYVRTLECLGFGFIEVGTVTPRPQAGNPRPRMFRLKQSGALINRMGFNNAGVDQLAARLARLKDRRFVLGANIGKNKDTPNEQAVEDYVECFEKLHHLVDYFVVNVSSPNTPNLRALQEKEPLMALLAELQQRNQKKSIPKPILLKIAPDLTDTQLDDIVEIADKTGLAGIVATNTTIARSGLREAPERLQMIGAGGLSGSPLRERATEVIAYLRSKDPGLLLIGVGGIRTASDVREKMEAGATLVQVYTGFIYEGPGMVRRILKEL